MVLHTSSSFFIINVTVVSNMYTFLRKLSIVQVNEREGRSQVCQNLYSYHIIYTYMTPNTYIEVL